MTSAGNPEVSVIIATYNMGQHVGQAIASVLAQQGHELEVIVVDDGSTDTTPRALEEFADEPRVRVLTQQNQGQPKAKNAGLRAARGRYIAFCDADDYWLPNKLDRQIPLLEQNSAVGVVYSTIVRLEPDGSLRSRASRPMFKGSVLEEMFVRNIVPFGTALVRRECFDQVGGFDESIPYGHRLGSLVAHRDAMGVRRRGRADLRLPHLGGPDVAQLARPLRLRTANNGTIPGHPSRACLQGSDRNRLRRYVHQSRSGAPER
jgi:glycosyltransferase involved in cell wall biosynthesis